MPSTVESSEAAAAKKSAETLPFLSMYWVPPEVAVQKPMNLQQVRVALTGTLVEVPVVT